MPIYTYICPECEEEKDVIQGFDDPAPSCENHDDEEYTMEKKPTFGGFILKGSCWYKDGYETKSNKKSKKNNETSKS